MTDNNKPNDQAHEYDVLADDYDLDEKEIYELVRKGMSMESIAGLAGLSLKQFEERLHLYPKYQARFRRALALFELDNIKALEESAGHQDAPLALKNKNARENLKTKEHWATASKPVVIQDGAKVADLLEPDYEEMSPEQQAAIREETEARGK